jgi:hypothetical protein
MNAAARREAPQQRRRIFAISHPEETIMLALGTAAAAASVHRIYGNSNRGLSEHAFDVATGGRGGPFDPGPKRDCGSCEKSNDVVRHNMYETIRDEKMRVDTQDRGDGGRESVGRPSSTSAGCRA